jgi:amylosucrase
MTAALLGLPDDPRTPPEAAALRRFVLLHALALWVGAVPLIYMGDELGQGNNADPADAARLAQDGRWLQRPRFSEQALAMQRVGEGVPAATFAALSALAGARRYRSWPAQAAVSVLAQAESALLVLRRGDDAIGLFHFGAKPISVDLAALGAATGWADLFVNGIEADGGALRRLQPWATLWRVREHG